MSKTVGVIGGMGPEATVEFLRRIVAATPANDDQDHIHVLVDNNPKIPSRLAAIVEGTGEDPLPTLIGMAKSLEKQGAELLAMPCNTAHYYRPRIADAVGIPFLDMVALSAAAVPGKRIGMLASPAVRRVGLYERQLRAAGKEAVFPEDDGPVLEIIRAVKANRVTDAHRRDYASIARALSADAYLVACTELSVLGAPPGATAPVVDALDVLVKATVDAAI
ncbi:MAG TPA: amino acid racemase [Rhizomicrobium sp.]|nr:amino acid racemase [Rhizomicrobium sp.]